VFRGRSGSLIKILWHDGIGMSLYATNNESERALRPSVIFRRVTNGFRSEWGAKVYADLCSIVATGRLAGRTALAAIRDALAPPVPARTAA
jgi:Transposase IS66 family